jgi:hypothetical protein
MLPVEGLPKTKRADTVAYLPDITTNSVNYFYTYIKVYELEPVQLFGLHGFRAHLNAQKLPQ